MICPRSSTSQTPSSLWHLRKALTSLLRRGGSPSSRVIATSASSMVRRNLSNTQLLRPDYPRSSLKKPARRTKECWEDALGDSLRFAGVSHPTAATKQHAVDYRSQLLEELSSSTVKTRLAYLGGLWSVLHEVKPECEQIFEGLNRRIRVERKLKQEFALSDPDEWTGSPDHVAVLRILYFTGARLAEIAGLMAEDIQDDRILIRPSEERSLKTLASERAIPIHPRLVDLMTSVKAGSGYLWPFLHQPSSGRWGANFSKPSQRIIGVNPKALRDRAATT